MQDHSKAGHFRQMALKCWQLAASTDDPRAIETLCKLAEEYERAARTGETTEVIGAPGNAKALRPAAGS